MAALITITSSSQIILTLSLQTDPKHNIFNHLRAFLHPFTKIYYLSASHLQGPWSSFSMKMLQIYRPHLPFHSSHSYSTHYPIW